MSSRQDATALLDDALARICLLARQEIIHDDTLTNEAKFMVLDQAVSAIGHSIKVLFGDKHRSQIRVGAAAGSSSPISQYDRAMKHAASTLNAAVAAIDPSLLQAWQEHQVLILQARRMTCM